MTIGYVTVNALRALPGFKLHLSFSNGDEGVRDFSGIGAEAGPMFEPMRNQASVAKAFLTYGVPTWPNGLQLDPSNLRLQIEAEGHLSHSIAAE